MGYYTNIHECMLIVNTNSNVEVVSTMVRKTKEEAQNTRKNILDAALDVFYVKGVAHSSLEDIAEVAGVTRGAVYWHFKNKADIFNELHGEVHMSFMNRMKDTQGLREQNAIEQLSKLCVDSLLDIATDLKIQKFFTVFFMKCDYSGDLSGLLEVQNIQNAETFEIISGFFNKAIEQDVIDKKSDTHFLSVSLFCYMGGIINEHLRNPQLIDLKKMAQPLVDFYLKKLV